FIEHLLIYCEEDPHLETLINQFRSARSHIPIRVVPTSFAIDEHNERIRALDQAQAVARGRWFVIMDPDVLLDRFAVEMAVEFAGLNEKFVFFFCPGI